VSAARPAVPIGADGPAPPGLVVAIDGPSGSGKSTVSRAVATRLGLRYLDTGAMYRAVTWAALDRGIDLADAAAVADVARRLAVDVSTDPAAPRVVVDGVDVTDDIRRTRISAAVSTVATNLDVRQELVHRQQRLVGTGDIVVEGRDITTVVAPDADVRILLTATPSERVNRRAREVHGRNDESALAATRDQVVRRDADDSSVAQFLEAAAGVVELDTSALTLEQVIATVLRLVEDATDHSSDRRDAPASVGKAGPA
jgi:CMP/dCMP kinase